MCKIIQPPKVTFCVEPFFFYSLEPPINAACKCLEASVASLLQSLPIPWVEIAENNNILRLIPEPSRFRCICRKVHLKSIAIFAKMAWYFKEVMMSFKQSRFPPLATAKHPHNKTGAPPCLTMEMVVLLLINFAFFAPDTS